MRSFGEAQSKAMRTYTQSGQYHTIVESRYSGIRAMSIEFSDVEQRVYFV